MVLMTKTWKKFTDEKNSYFFDQKFQFIYPQASIKNVQTFSPQIEKNVQMKKIIFRKKNCPVFTYPRAIKDVQIFSPQKRTFCTSKLETSSLFSFFVG
jgi:hypothetical protein